MAAEIFAPGIASNSPLTQSDQQHRDPDSLQPENTFTYIKLKPGVQVERPEAAMHEFALRKVMGASRWDILRFLGWQFARPVLWANVIAWPLAYVGMRRWLEGFAYHVDLNPLVFVAASILALVIALATVSGHALMVARTRPVEALRYE